MILKKEKKMLYIAIQVNNSGQLEDLENALLATDIKPFADFKYGSPGVYAMSIDVIKTDIHEYSDEDIAEEFYRRGL